MVKDTVTLFALNVVVLPIFHEVYMKGFRRNLCGKPPYKNGTKIDVIITPHSLKPESVLNCESQEIITSGKYAGKRLVIGATLNTESVRGDVSDFELLNEAGDVLAYRKHKPTVKPKPRYYTSWDGKYIAVSFDGVKAAPFGNFSRYVSFEMAEFIMQGVVSDTPNQTILNDRWSTVDLKTSELFFKEILPE